MNIGPKAERLKNGNGVAAPIAVAGAVSAYTHSIKTEKKSTFALAVKCAGTGPNVKVYLQQGLNVPATEGSAEAGVWVSPDALAAALLTITDENWHYIAVSPVALPFLRFHYEGQGGSGSDVTVDAYLCSIENWG